MLGGAVLFGYLQTAYTRMLIFVSSSFQICHGDIKTENVLLTGWDW